MKVVKHMNLSSQRSLVWVVRDLKMKDSRTWACEWSEWENIRNPYYISWFTWGWGSECLASKFAVLFFPPKSSVSQFILLYHNVMMFYFPIFFFNVIRLKPTVTWRIKSWVVNIITKYVLFYFFELEELVQSHILRYLIKIFFLHNPRQLSFLINVAIG